jgi:hypothetical protein
LLLSLFEKPSFFTSQTITADGWREAVVIGLLVIRVQLPEKTA